MASFLQAILESVARRVEALASQRAALERQAAAAPPARSLRAALEQPGFGVIAECKRRSPSRGWLVADPDSYRPDEVAADYQARGADAVSVLTEPDFFAGAMAHLAAVRRRVGVPVLCKDFIVAPEQILAARAAGADAVLLIVRVVPDPARLAALRQTAEGLGMEALVEIHAPAELEVALAADARLIGVNNRDLDSFATGLETSRTVAAGGLPVEVTAVSESGFAALEDVAQVRAWGYRGVLVGEALMRGSRLLEEIRAWRSQ